MLGDVSLYRLQVFCEVAENQSFRIAAENLFISQPAVSAHILALEKETEIMLIERGRVSRLTEAGQIFYNYSKNTLKGAEEISQIMRELRSGEIGRINMGANGTLARYIIPIIFSKFKRENPSVKLLLRPGNPRQICQMTLDREIDFGFIVSNSHITGLTAKALIKDELVIVASPNHPLNKKAIVSVEELYKHPFVFMANEYDGYNVIEGLLNTHGIDIRERFMELGDAESIKQVLMSGVGVSALLRQCVANELRTGHLKKINLNHDPITVDYLLLLRPDKYLTPLHKKFLKFFETTVKQISPLPLGQVNS